MPAGTITLTNNSTAVTGSGTAFPTELKANDFLVSVVGGTTYTLGVKSVESATALTLTTAYGGPTTCGLAWTPIPNGTLVGITAQIAADTARAIRGLNYDKQNWQQVYSSSGNITVLLPDGSSYTGPSWKYLSTTMDSKVGYVTNASSPISEMNALLAKGDKIALAPTQGVVDFRAISSAPLTLPVGVTRGMTTPQKEGLSSNFYYGSPPYYGNFMHAESVRGWVDDTASGSSFTELTWPTGKIIVDGDTKKRAILNCSIQDSSVNNTQVITNPGNIPITIGSIFVYTEAVNPPPVAGILYQHCALGGEYRQQTISSYQNSSQIYSRSRNGDSGTWLPWVLMWNSGNTTVDSNGFIKRASPVIKIFADGRAETNDESDGALVIRQDVGRYLITGVLGMNSDAVWGGIDGGFEIPVDRNKQPRLWLDYEMNPDGSILVKTYHRTNPEAPEFARNRIGHSNDDGSFTELVKNGEPVDIPADSFVSVRVEMPADSIWNQKQATEVIPEEGELQS